jgi:hypothetical protein
MLHDCQDFTVYNTRPQVCLTASQHPHVHMPTRDCRLHRTTSHPCHGAKTHPIHWPTPSAQKQLLIHAIAPCPIGTVQRPPIHAATYSHPCHDFITHPIHSPIPFARNTLVKEGGPAGLPAIRAFLQGPSGRPWKAGTLAGRPPSGEGASRTSLTSLTSLKTNCSSMQLLH